VKRRYVCYTAFLRRAEGVKQKARLFLIDFWKEYYELWLMIPNPPLWRKKMALFDIQNAKGLILLDGEGANATLIGSCIVDNESAQLGGKSSYCALWRHKNRESS
jgi:hypothetical protein